jgi:hypothetical protein
MVIFALPLQGFNPVIRLLFQVVRRLIRKRDVQKEIFKVIL